MNRSRWLWALSLLGTVMACSPQAAPEEAPAAAPAAAAAPGEAGMELSADEIMASWMKHASPGPEHTLLGKSVGSWETTTRIWMDPAKTAETTRGRCEIRLIMGGRFLQQECSGEVMGQPFEGIGIEGYDNFKKKYVSVWFDNLSTSLSVMSGNCDTHGERCAFFGTMDEFLTGEVGKPVMSTTRWEDEDTIVFEMYDLQGGPDWVRVMEIVYERAG